MSAIKSLRINKKLMLISMCIGIIPLTIFSIVGLISMNDSSNDVTQTQLESIRIAKYNQLYDFFSERKYEAELLAKVVDTLKSDGEKELSSVQDYKLQMLNNYFSSLEMSISFESKNNKDFATILLNNSEALQDNNVIQQYSDDLESYLLENNLEDIYIVSVDGRVLYSQKERDDLGTSLNGGVYKDEGLARVWKKVILEERMIMDDFSTYSPSNMEQLAFIGNPILDDSNNIIGMFAVSFTPDKIKEIVQTEFDLGDSSETYVAANSGGHILFRSDMYTMGDGKYVVGYELASVPEYARLTFQGQSVNEIFKDSAGNMVVVSTDPVRFLDIEWIMVTKVDLEDLIAPKSAEGMDYYSTYVQDHAYNNIFLIHPDGYVFYSANEGFEYKMNLFEGEFGNTNHAELVKGVIDNNDFCFVDYEANELNNFKPRAFMGLPIYDNNNNIEFVLSFEVSSSAINEIMLERTGLGEYGEAYLIGPDYLLRSDTYLEPITKSISNSFKNPDEGSIRSEAVFKVLAGKEGTFLMEDYRGVNSLISYAPINIYGQNWGLVVKVDRDEAFSHIRSLIILMIIIALVTIIVIAIVAQIISRSISKPIVELSKWAKEVASGSLEYADIEVGNDEIGDMKESFSRVVDSFNKVTTICEDISIGRLDQQFELRSDSDKLGQSINGMRQNFLQVIHQANSVANNDYSVTIEQRSQEDELAIALVNMVEKLKKATDESVKQDWIKTGQSNLNEIIQEATDNRMLAKESISYIARYINAIVGVFMVKDHSEYNLLGSYAFNTRKHADFNIQAGEGVVGQAILEKEIIYLKDVPNEDLMIESSSVNMKANHVIVMPCVFEDDVKCIIELASYSPFNEIQIEFLKKVQENLAIAIHSNVVNEEVKELLAQTMKQSEALKLSQNDLKQKNEELSMQTEALRNSEMQLQQQQEELRQSNEELEAQTMELKASESKLQEQQEELRVINEELEEKNQNLQMQKEEIGIKNEELNKTQKMIEEKAKEVEISSKYKSEFLANMSHELRTPLNSILILSGFLLEDKNDNLTKNEREYAEVINSAGKDLLGLINDILDLSKIESGKMDLNIESFEIRKTIDEIYQLFSPITNEKGINLLSTIDPNCPVHVYSDEMKLSQVIKNLLSNAVKFTSEGQIEVIVKPIDGNYIELAVKDSGIGIAEEKLDHIFGAFQQADGTTSRNFGGTGLGLSITKELVTLLKGSLRVESVEGEGSIFTVTLPLALDESGQINKSKLITIHPSQELALETISDSKPEKNVDEKIDKVIIEDEEMVVNVNEIKINLPDDYDSVIMIIEDDSNFARILENMARERGHEVICVDSGEKGLAVVQEVEVGAIVLDLGLPGMSGWEVLHRLKKWRKTKDIPIHIMSGRELDNQHKNSGFIDYLQKPISSEKLNHAFEQIEVMINKVIKKLLIISSEEKVVGEIVDKYSEKFHDITITKAYSANEGIDILKEETYDCIVIGTNLNDMNCEELAKKIRVNDIAQTPIILYTEQKLSKEKSDEMVRYVESIIIKGDKSMSRLLDETTLFLNHVEESHRQKVTEFMKTMNEKEAVLSGKKVLIVDDDMRNTFALSSVLEDRGMDIIIAKNGEIGIEKLIENPDTDIVLMDIMMPVMDGYAAIRKIRKMNETFSQVPIIALTAKAMREDKEKCISAGANDYMAKPIKMDELQTLMKVWIY